MELQTDLETLVEHACHCQGIRKAELRQGDWVVVTTRNSRYAIHVLGDNVFTVSGGWFDRKGLSPLEITINGCTWGGSAIKHDIVAAPGLFLEFGNHVLTTRIQQVQVIRTESQIPN